MSTWIEVRDRAQAALDRTHAMPKRYGFFCGYTLVDKDGEQYPCDRPARRWRWYQDVEHEDMIDEACETHANAAGGEIAAARTDTPTLAGAVIAVLDLHKPVPVYRSAGDCLTPDQHEQSYDTEADWWYCEECEPRPWGHVCTTCRDGNGLHEVTWPCLDARALGVTE